jgi:hypothetical protein
VDKRVDSGALGEGQAGLDAPLIPSSWEGPPSDDDANVGGRQLVRDLKSCAWATGQSGSV